MEFTGRYTIRAQPEAIWAALNDPDVLKACIPGCEALSRTDATHFIGSARLKIGPLSATFRGKVTLSELDPPRRCIVKGEGEGGVAGFARGQAEILLTPEENQTVLSYKADANVGGKLAQVGQRLVDGAARQIADEFFSRFTTEVGAIETPPVSTAAQALKSDILAFPASPPRREGLVPEIWVAGLVAVIVTLVVLFGIVLR